MTIAPFGVTPLKGTLRQNIPGLVFITVAKENSPLIRDEIRMHSNPGALCLDDVASECILRSVYPTCVLEPVCWMLLAIGSLCCVVVHKNSGTAAAVRQEMNVLLLKLKSILWRRLACTFSLLHFTPHTKKLCKEEGCVSCFSDCLDGGNTCTGLVCVHVADTWREESWTQEVLNALTENRSVMECTDCRQPMSTSEETYTHTHHFAKQPAPSHTHSHCSLVKYGPVWNEWLSLCVGGRSLLCIPLVRQ